MKNKAVTRNVMVVSLLLAVAVLLSACNLIVKDPEVDARQVIVSVNGEEIRKDRFTQFYNNAYNQEYARQQTFLQYGMIQKININRDDVLDFTATAVVRDLVLRQKAKELGLDAFTPEEETKVQEAAAKQFEELLGQIKSEFFPGTELSGEELDKALRDKADELGITADRLAEDEKAVALFEKLKEHVTKDLSVSDEEIQADFDQKVADAKISYENDPSAYGRAVNAGQKVYTAPAGYRFVKQILVKFTEEDQKALDALKEELKPLAAARDAAQTALDEYQEAHKDEEGAKADEAELLAFENALKEAQASHDAKQAELSAKEAAAYAAILPRANEAYAKAVAEGADFDALIKEYNEDKEQPAQGYAVFKEFTDFDEAFLKPAMALEKTGDVAEPSPGIFGYYIVQYAADIPEGPVALETVRDSIHDALLADKKDAAFIQAGDEWVAAADVKTFVDRMKD